MHKLSVRLAFVCLLSAAACGTARPQEQAKSPPVPIPDLIRQLGSDRYREREAAQKALLANDEVFPDLRRALLTLNAEGRRRAEAILEVMNRRRMKRFLQYGREGRVDLLVEWSSLAGDRIDNEAFWQCVLDISWDLLDRSQTEKQIQEDWKKQFPARNYAQFRKSRPSFISDADTLLTARLPTHLAIRDRNGVQGDELWCSIVSSAGHITLLKGGVRHSILFATGDVKVDIASNVLIVADGRVQLRTASQAVIAARNDVLKETDLDFSRVRPRGNLLLGDPSRNIYIPPPTPEEAEEPRADRIRFFEPIDAGLRIVASKGHVRVAEIQANSPFSKAGLKSGDIISAIDGNPVADFDSARRRLRRAFVQGGAELHLLRNAEPLTINVSFFGWELPPVKATKE